MRCDCGSIIFKVSVICYPSKTISLFVCRDCGAEYEMTASRTPAGWEGIRLPSPQWRRLPTDRSARHAS